MTAEPTVIRSTSNSRLRELRRFTDDARARKAAGVSVLEGDHLVGAWRAGGGEIIDWFVRESHAAATVAALGSGSLADGRPLPAWPAPLVVADRLLAAAGSLPSPALVIAVIRTPRPDLPDILDGDVVILDRLQDPANVGAILRTVAAAGLERVIATPGTASGWSPKALRAGMGGQFGLTLHEGVDVATVIERLAVPLVATVAHGGDDLATADLTGPLAWWLGNEGEGIAAADGQRAGLRLRIDQSPAVESLNVAAATAVCLFEQRRQRRALATGPLIRG